MQHLARAAFALLLTIPLSAEAPVEVPVAEAIVFKNGLAFVTREGTIAFRGGAARVPAPDALLGTLWVGAGDRRIELVRSVKEDVAVESEATSIAELVDANVGKSATVLVDDREYSGRLRPAPAPLLLLEVDGKIHAFPRDRVKSVSFAGAPALKLSRNEPRTLLSLQAMGSDGSERATLRYLRRGLSWIPETTIELLDAERARVTLKAMLINDGEELRKSRVRFAVGYPNFAFAHVPSPATQQQTLQDFLATLAGDGFRRDDRFANVMTQRVMMNAPTMGDEAVLAGPPALGESAEDLFFYEQEGVTLAKGERALYPILSDVVPFRHLYRWTVSSERRDVPVPQDQPADQVWHSISLTNRGTTPWTTSPALVLTGAKPLAQDTLPYTAAGSRGEVKLTVATDVSVERTETEVERKPRDLQRFGYTYDAVIVEGTLTMRNFKREPITLEVTKTIEGESTLREANGKATRLALQPRAVNPSERLEWQVALTAGESRTVKYRYKVWVRD